MRFAVALALLSLMGCRRLATLGAGTEAGAPPPRYDAGPPFPQNALPELPPGTRVVRSSGYSSIGGILSDEHAIYWAANREFQWAPLVSGMPQLGISIADYGLENPRVLAKPARIQGHLSQDADSIYALQQYAHRECEYGVCKVPPSTEVYRISKKDGKSTRIAMVPDWVEASVWSGGRLLVAGAVSGKLWSLDAAGAPTVVAQGLPSEVVDIAEAHSTLYILSHALSFYAGTTPRRALMTLPLPLLPGAIARELPLARDLSWLAGGEHLYAGIFDHPGTLLRLSANGEVEASLEPVCPKTAKNQHAFLGVAARGKSLRWLCTALGEGYVAANDAPPWQEMTPQDAGVRAP